MYQIGLSLDPQELERQAEEFAAINRASAEHFHGCIMAIDGWVVQTRKPRESEVDIPMRYRNRKGIWGFTVFAGCDARTRFTMFTCNSAGSANDIMVWQSCKIYNKVLKKGKLPQRYFIIGDEAFSCEPQILVPWSGRGLENKKDWFNYHLSVRRQVIERAFGILTQLWCLFHRPLTCDLKKWTLIATVAAKLQNVCVDMNDTRPHLRYERDVQIGDMWTVIENLQEDDHDLVQRASSITGSRRSEITEMLLRDTIRRPAHAMYQSRAAIIRSE